MKKFIFYIILFFLIFNISIAKANDNKNDFSILEQTYKVNNLADNINEGQKITPYIKGNNKFVTFLMIPYLADKVFKDSNIKNEDMVLFLKLFYPNTNESKLIAFGNVVKYAIYTKRWYKDIVKKAEHEAMANKIFSQDAPIIAKDGEFLAEDDLPEANSSSEEYIVSNNLYKYLEYDTGELGEPVRLRDKNYVPRASIDDLALAILKFDLKGFIKALKNMPAINDGSAEKPFITKHGLKARILLDTSKIATNKSFLGVVEVFIPSGYYINGELLDDTSRPNFIISEDKNKKLNISKFSFFVPDAIGVEKDGVAKKIFINTVSFPFYVERKELNKSVTVLGEFYFELCDNNDFCELLKTEHEIRLKTSLDDMGSIYKNYVAQAHAHLPQNIDNIAKIENVIFDKNTKELKIYYSTSKQINNIAVMVEDYFKSSYVNPRYDINNDTVVATFDVRHNDLDINIDKIMVTTLINNKTSRDLIDITKDFNYDFNFSTSQNIPWWKLLLIGIVINLLPGCFYFVLKNINLIIRKENMAIYLRYCIGILIAILCFNYLFLIYGVGFILSSYWCILFNLLVLN